MAIDSLSRQQEEDLKRLVMRRLNESDWREKIVQHCAFMASSRRGRPLLLDQMVNEVTPFARASVPLNIKAELLEYVKEGFEQMHGSETRVNVRQLRN